MSELSRSSAIRGCLLDLENQNSEESDIEIVWDDVDMDNLTDFSSGSGELYEPRLSDLSDSDREEVIVNVDNEGNNERQDDPQPDDPNLPQPNDPNPTPNPTWVRVDPPEPEQKPEEMFKVRNPGIRNCPPRNSSPITYFYMFFTNTVWNLLVNETNKYAAKIIEDKRASGNMGPFSRLQRWTDVSIPEMKSYIALVINMGLTPRNNVEKYWSTLRSLHIPFFPRTMSLNRFQIISSMFHISSTPYFPRNQPGHDSWYKVRTFLDLMNNYFKKFFVPFQNLSIDESMIGMKNRFAHIMYMPNKRHARFGIKKFEVVDSKYSYILHTAPYNGKLFLSDGNDPFTQKVIIHLLTECNLLHKWHHVFTDNYYTKLPLAQQLFKNETFLTGTVNKNTKDLTKDVVKAKLDPQTSIYYRNKDILLVGYKEKKEGNLFT